MKKSEKLSLAVSVALFVLSAVFSIALLAELFSANSNNSSVFHSIGSALIGAYGVGSVLIPLFLLAAGILSFLPTWSLRRWLLLASSIVPFFTIIITEKLCKGFAAEGDLLGAVKIGVTLVICVLFLILQYLSCCIAADNLEKWVNDHFVASGDEGDEEEETNGVSIDSAETSAIDTISDSTNTPSVAAEEAEPSVKVEPSKESESVAETTKPAEMAETTAKAEPQATEQPTETSKPLVNAESTETSAPIEKTEPQVAEEPTAAETVETVGAENVSAPETTTAMFSISAEDIEKAREAEKAELEKEAKEAQKKNPTEISKITEPIADDEDDSFVIVPVAEDEAAFITDDTPIEKDTTEAGREGVIDLSITASGDVFGQSEPTIAATEIASPPIEEKKPSVFDKAIEAVDRKAKIAENPHFQSGDTLDADFFDIDMNAEDDDEREEREARERTFSVYEDRPLVIEKPIIVGEYDKAVSEPLNSVFAKMEQDVQAESKARPSLLQTAIQLNEAEATQSSLEEKEPSLDIAQPQSQTTEPPLEVVEPPLDAVQTQSQATESPFSNTAEPTLDAEPPSEVIADKPNEESEIENAPAKAETEAATDYIEEQSIEEEPIEQEPLAVELPQTVPVAPLTKEPEAEKVPLAEAEPVAQEVPKAPLTKEPVAPVAPVAPVPQRYRKEYAVPTDILTAYSANPYWEIDEETKQAAENLTNTLSEFKIDAEVTGIRKGPVVTMFEMLPAPGVKLSKIVALQDNIALRLAAKSVRIVAPIPGKRAVGIEVPNRERAVVSFREIIEEDNPAWAKMAVPVILGKDISGESKIMDLVKTPHLLIAGATGAGKSVCVNSLILSILYKRSPEQVRLILIDPKIVELKLYNDIPHLLTPVITEPKKAFQALQYCLCEMERRYALLDGMQVRDIESYNKRIVERGIATEKLPYIVVIIDEFADLMATSGKELETTVARLCAMSRAVGIHLVLATQRPSIDVITGLIKANIPSRIAFMVASKMDSRIIIDQIGAEKLLGKGDMLYAGVVDPFPVRIQGTLVNDLEVENVVDYVKTLGEPDYIDDEIFIDDEDDDSGDTSYASEGEDPLYEKALDIVIQAGKASASYIQRRLKIGYNRAARLVEEMEERGIVGPANGSKPREIIHVP